MRLSASLASGRHPHTSNTPVALLMCALVAMLVGTFAVPSTVYAQAVTGTLLGNVTDSSGGAVPGATVTATETQTNISRTAVSNETGHYIFSSLKNGTYTVEAELQGFRKIIRQNVRVDVNTTMRVDLTLESGQLTEAVTVVGRDADSADRPDRHRPHDRIQDGDRDPARLQPELPGPARHRARRDTAPPRRTRSSSTRRIRLARRDQRPAAHGEQHAHRRAGQQSEDGPAERHHSGRRRARDRQRLDQQLRRRVRPIGRRDHQRDAQVRHELVQGAAGSSSATPRRPTPATTSRTSRRRRSSRRAGSRLAGPIMRNKFFFFGDYQRTIDNLGYVVRATIPTMAMRNGDFSAVANGHLRPDDGRGQWQRPHGVCEQPDPAEPNQPDRAPGCSPLFPSPTSPARRSVRTTTRRRRRARRRPTPSIRS